MLDKGLNCKDVMFPFCENKIITNLILFIKCYDRNGAQNKWNLHSFLEAERSINLWKLALLDMQNLKQRYYLIP